MAQRKNQRQNPSPPRAKPVVSAVGRAEPRSAEDWQREYERVNAELAAAKAEIASLRSAQEQVLNRIDWVIDSIDSLSASDS